MVMNPRIKIHCQLILSMLMWYISFIFQLYEKELYSTELQRKQMEYHTIYLTEKFQNKFNGQFLLNGTDPQDSGLTLKYRLATSNNRKPEKNNFTPLDSNGPLCMILEFLHYYFWMATCSWGCLESIQVLHAYYFSMNGYLNMAWLCFIGWFGPLLLIVSWSICKFESSNMEPLECWPIDAVQCDWWLITFPIFSMLVIGLM